MSILQNTISTMKTLPEADLIKIQAFTRKLSRRHELELADEAVGRFLKPMSKEDFLKDVETVEQEITEGKYSSTQEVFSGLEHRYGL